VLDLSSFILHHMPDESHKDETCKSHITLVQLLYFILYHLCNFPVFVSMLYMINSVLHLEASTYQVTEPDSAVSAFDASSATLLKVCRVGLKPGDLRTCNLLSIIKFRCNHQFFDASRSVFLTQE